MNEQEFLEYIEAYRGDAIERIYGLLAGTNNDKEDNIHRILDNFAYKVRGVVLSVDTPTDEYGNWETLGPCGCTDYHMADCPLRTG